VRFIQHASRDVTGREHALHPADTHELVDRDAAEAVSIDTEKLGDRTGAHAGTPDDRGGVDHLA
jgi:hypothetical protein